MGVFKRLFKMNLLKSKPFCKQESNLTRLERTGITELAQKPDIVIKKADKGSAVVVMQTADYLCEGYRQLMPPFHRAIGRRLSLRPLFL